MKFLCLAGRHAVAPAIISNAGIDFGSCRRCHREMIRRGTQWKRVPAGLRIVWRAADRAGPAGEGPVRNLPMVIGVQPAETRRTAAPVARPASRKPRRARRSFSFGELVPAGFRLLAWAGADGLRHWRKNLATRRAAQKPMRLLAAH